MRVALVYPDYFESGIVGGEPQGRVHLGCGYLSGALKAAGHEVSFVHILEPPRRDEFLRRIFSDSPGLVGFSSTSLMFSKVCQMSRWVKEESDLPVVVGGVHTTLDPIGALEESSIDMICVGEGEQTLVELAGALDVGGDLESIGSLMGRFRGKTFSNPVRPLVEDLDSIPFPDRSIFNPELLAPDQKDRISVMASRGCPYRCTYCSNHALRNAYPNPERYVRFRGVDNVLSEIEGLAADASRTGVDHVRFEDDILTLKPKWFEEFTREYPRRISLPFICNSRVDLLDEEKIRKLKESGCITVCMGIESGNQWLRKNVLGRKMDDTQILEAFRLCRQYGLGTVSLNMMGFPHERFSMLLDTLKLNGRARPGLTQITAFYPLPGTEMHEVCRDEGMILEEDVDTLFARSSGLNLKDLSKRQMWLVGEFFTPLAYLYNRIYALPAPLARVAEFACDAFLSSELVPFSWKEKLGDYLHRRLPWDWFLGTRY